MQISQKIYQNSFDILTKSKKWNAEKDVEKFVEKTCQKIIPLTELKKIPALEIAISLVCDSQMKKINQQFRQKNKPTNVLSFSALDKAGMKKAAKSRIYCFLGDIVISYETVKKESLAQKKPFREHLTHLILHSILHLIGHDHEEEKMAEKMENLEIKILQKLKIKNPYSVE